MKVCLSGEAVQRVDDCAYFTAKQTSCWTRRYISHNRHMNVVCDDDLPDRKEAYSGDNNNILTLTS